MGFIYCITSSVLQKNHYKIGMTSAIDECSMRSSLRNRYSAAYACDVNIVYFKEVRYHRRAEKHVHSKLSEYNIGGECFHCDKQCVIDVFDTLPQEWYTVEYVPLQVQEVEPIIHEKTATDPDENMECIPEQSQEVEPITHERTATDPDASTNIVIAYECPRCTYTTHNKCHYTQHMLRKKSLCKPLM